MSQINDIHKIRLGEFLRLNGLTTANEDSRSFICFHPSTNYMDLVQIQGRVFEVTCYHNYNKVINKIDMLGRTFQNLYGISCQYVYINDFVLGILNS